MEEAKYSFNVPLPKNSTYDTATMLTIRADHSDELKNSIDAVFGAGTYDRVTALALVTIQSLPTRGTPALEPQIAAASTPSASGAGSTTSTPGVPATSNPASGSQYPPKQTYGACPDCGEGQIVDKFRTAAKGGGFMGRGCDAYNRNGCNYMAFWANR
jgi:hypothetical protein